MEKPSIWLCIHRDGVAHFSTKRVAPSFRSFVHGANTKHVPPLFSFLFFFYYVVVVVVVVCGWFFLFNYIPAQFQGPLCVTSKNKKRNGGKKQKTKKRAVEVIRYLIDGIEY